MPIHLPTPVQDGHTSRREFIASVGVGVLTFSAVSWGAETAVEKDAVEEDLVYLLNDTHIGEKHPADSPIPSHLRQLVAELVERSQKPAAVLINGDLALKDGQPGDYRHLAKLIAPLQTAKLNLHLTLGNHDHRDVFYKVMQEQRPESPVVNSRHISVVKTRHANFFLLDSLQKTMVTQGTLGEQQLKWLATALDQNSETPAIIVSHHTPRLGGDPLHFPGGLIDSQPLWNVLAPRKQVKAYVHGHIHHRSLASHQGIHIINTPATSYVGNPDSTTGWTTAKLRRDGVQLTTHTFDKAHAWHGAVDELKWRS